VSTACWFRRCCPVGPALRRVVRPAPRLLVGVSPAGVLWASVGWGWVWKSVGCRVGWFVGALLGPEGTRVPPVSCGGFRLFSCFCCGGGAAGGCLGGGGCGLSRVLRAGLSAIPVPGPVGFFCPVGAACVVSGVGGLVGWGFGGGVWAGVRSWFENCIVDASIFVAKLLRAHGGCLGTRSR
jgi:hypothetical protein